jgi:Putative transposase/Phage integrase family
LSSGTVAIRLAALRFFYTKTLKKGWSIAETPYPKKDHRLPVILSQEEVAQLIAAASTVFHRTLLMTLYATGARNGEVTQLKFSDVDSQRMVIHIQGGKGRKDRDVMLSPKLLEELREHWRRLRRKPRVWLFPGNHDHCADHPIDTKTVWHACQQAAQRAGGLSLDHTRWVRSRDNYFLPKKVLRKIFRGKFVDALDQAFQNGQLRFEGDLKLLAQPKIFAAWLRPLFRQDWVVYLKRPFGGPEYVLHYLGRYTHRVAISNHRLVSFADGQVTFRWRDSAHHNEQKLLSLSLDEFLCRFLLHILPKGFVRIRNFGFLANRKRATLLPLCLQLLGSAQQPQADQHASSTEDGPDLWRCPQCGGPMKVIERLTAAEIQLRSPPPISSAA